MAYGFGYLPSTNEYKIVSIHYDNRKQRGGMVSVYTVGSGKWRNKGEISYLLFDTSSAGALANGTIYWFPYWQRKIVWFDLADEEFREVVISKLQPAAASTDYFGEYGVLGGCLCVTRGNVRSQSPKDIWVLNHDVLTSTNHNNNMEEEEEEEKEFSWIKKFSIPWEHWKGITNTKLEHQLVLKSGTYLLLATGTHGLVSYDPKTESFNESIFPLGYEDRIFPYTKSFVSLKALGEENAKCWGFVAHDQPQVLAQQQLQYNSFQ